MRSALPRSVAGGGETHTQHGPYIDVLPLLMAVQRGIRRCARSARGRPSGLPFSLTLLVHGTDAMTDTVRAAVATTEYTVGQLRAIDDVEVVLEPELTVAVPEGGVGCRPLDRVGRGICSNTRSRVDHHLEG